MILSFGIDKKAKRDVMLESLKEVRKMDLFPLSKRSLIEGDCGFPQKNL
jgi:hypothetical protein